jgi:hypothetical protein
VVKSKYYPSINPEGLRKTTKKLRILGVPAEILTEHFPTSSLEHYLLTILVVHSAIMKR